MTAAVGPAAADLGRRLDLRLVPATAAVWLVVLAGSIDSRGPLWCCTAAGIVAALTGVVRLHRERGPAVRRLGAGILMAGVAACAAGAVTVARQEQRLDSPLRLAAQQRAMVTVHAVVAGDPEPLSSRSAGPRVLVPLTVSGVSVRGRTYQLSGAAVVLGPAEDWGHVLPGQRVVVKGRASVPLSRSVEDASISQRGPPRLIGGPPPLQRLAGQVRSALSASSARVLPADAAGLLVALVDGDTSGVDPVVEADFRQMGLSHLLAVSGANCAIVCGAALWLTRRLRLPFAAQIALSALALGAFVVVARPSPSVLRAAAMGVVTLLAMASGRMRSAVPALTGSVLVLLMLSPGLATSAGFALSVAATAGIVVLAPPWTARLGTMMPWPVAAAVAVAGAAGLATAPLLIMLNPVLNLASVPANIAAAPAVPFATVLGVLAAMVAPWWSSPADLLIWLAGIPVRWLLWVADLGTALPEAQIRWPAGLLGVVALIATIAAGAVLIRGLRRRPRLRSFIAAAMVGAIVLAVPLRAAIRSWPPDGWLVVACDVGQGDALVIRAGPHSAVVTDVGPDPVAVDRCLRELGVTDVPLLILSHLHQDHIGGLSAVLGRRPVGEVAVSESGQPVPAWRRLVMLAGRLHVPVHTPALSERRVVGTALVTVLGPLAPRRNTRSDPNNNSLLIRVDIRGVSILLAGDSEVEEQAEYVGGQVPLLDVDVLKVPHHGSAYQTAAFLAQTSARVALVSVGAGNDYGHPSPLTIGELRRLGMAVYRTDRSGDVAVALVDGQLAVSTNPTVT